MDVLALTTQKGGSGKTSLVVAALQDGERVAILDTDQQRSLTSWRQRRKAGELAVQAVEPSGFKAALSRLRADGGITLVLQEASLCLLAVKPSIFDVEAARPTVEQLRMLGRRFGFVLNQCNATTQARTLDAAIALVKAGALAPSMVASRSDFLDAMTRGQGVTEFAPHGKAAVEIRLLWQWAKSQLEGSANG